MNKCYVCETPIDPDRFICYDCAKAILNSRVYCTFGRCNGKSFIRNRIAYDLEYYKFGDILAKERPSDYILTKAEVTALFEKYLKGESND